MIDQYGSEMGPPKNKVVVSAYQENRKTIKLVNETRRELNNQPTHLLTFQVWRMQKGD